MGEMKSVAAYLDLAPAISVTRSRPEQIEFSNNILRTVGTGSDPSATPTCRSTPPATALAFEHCRNKRWLFIRRIGSGAHLIGSLCK